MDSATRSRRMPASSQGAWPRISTLLRSTSLFLIYLCGLAVAPAGASYQAAQASDAPTPSAAASERKTKVRGIEMDLATVRKIGDVHPGAALVLLNFHESHRMDGLNLYRGEMTIVGRPTPRTVELMLDHADEAALRQSLEPLQGDQSMRVKWKAVDAGDDVLVVTFTSELGEIVDDELVPRQLTHPRTIVTVTKSPPRLVSAVHETDASRAALSQLRDYVEANIRRDTQSVVSAWPPSMIELAGGKEAALARVHRQYETADDMALHYNHVELGSPRIFHGSHNVYAAIPSLQVARAFPSDVEDRHVYILVSADKGRNWSVIEMACFTEENMKKAFADAPGIPVEELRKSSIEPALVVTANEPKKN